MPWVVQYLRAASPTAASHCSRFSRGSVSRLGSMTGVSELELLDDIGRAGGRAVGRAGGVFNCNLMLMNRRLSTMIRLQLMVKGSANIPQVKVVA